MFHPTSWECWNKKHINVIGLVFYDEKWKMYVFAPGMDTIYSVSCMQDIIHFIGQLKPPET